MASSSSLIGVSVMSPIMVYPLQALEIVIAKAQVRSRMSLTLPIPEPMKVGSQMIQFMTLLLEKTIQTRDCKITPVLKLELPMGQM